MNATGPVCRLSMRTIIDLAAQFFGVSIIEIVSQRREARLVEARHIAMFAIRSLLPRSYPEIGRAFGHRDHTSVRLACLNIERDMEADDGRRERVESFLALCRGATPLTPPDADPFEAARRIMQRPGLATNVSIETIRDFAAIVSAAIEEAGRQDAEAEKLEALRASFEAVRPALHAFVNAFHALGAASDRGEAQARKTFEARAAALVADFETHFHIERTFK